MAYRGDGDLDRGSANEIELVSGPLSEPLAHSFALTVPQQPWSYAGHYINIIWQVSVVVDIPLGGDTINFSGHATDLQDGPLPASALTWSLISRTKVEWSTMGVGASTGTKLIIAGNFKGY